jgi:predicted N-acetyltransferase YhbS
MSAGIAIRLVQTGEHDAVDELVREAYEFDYGPRDHGHDPFRLAVNRARATDLWVAVDAGTGALVGTITVGRLATPRMMDDALPDELDFRLLAVSPSARGRGIGEALVRHVIEQAGLQSLRGVFMKSGPDMVGAHRLYTRVGFRRDTARDGLFRDGVKVLDLFAFAIDIPAHDHQTASSKGTR